jgi:hypothetical protein
MKQILYSSPKKDKDTAHKRELQAHLFNEHSGKNPQKKIGKSNSIAYQKDHTQ